MNTSPWDSSNLPNPLVGLWSSLLGKKMVHSIFVLTSEASIKSQGNTITHYLRSPIDLTGVPSEYHDFSDIFDKARASTLAPHRPYDLKLDLEEGTSPSFGPIYSLSQSELKSLQIFLDEHLSMGFI